VCSSFAAFKQRLLLRTRRAKRAVDATNTTTVPIIVFDTILAWTIEVPILKACKMENLLDPTRDRR
jgi:hypothetical protein